jgi:hypothetical protein
MLTTAEPATTRVTRGYSWLKNDGHLYGLDIRRLNPDTIRVADPGRCPLAQAAGATFGRGLHMVGRSGDFTWATKHGFWATYNDYGGMLPYSGGNLDEVWRQLLTQLPVEPEPVDFYVADVRILEPAA